MTSPIVSDPAIAVTPVGTATVAYDDPADGAVRAPDLGAASVVVGYGAPATANRPSIAQNASLTVAVWRDASAAIVAATRSDVVAPGVPGCGAGLPIAAGRS